jgi:tyrosine-protein phosphatase 2/3
MISSVQLKDMIDSIPGGQFLLLDLRVFPQFSQSRIHDALNLCIPTTLLKRPSFNLQKLQDTFTNEAEKVRFSQWRNAKYIVVYDAFSDEKKDATSAINTLKKFSNEGWKGRSYILRGGFADFSKNFPQLIDDRSTQESQSSKISLSLGTSGPEVAPVAGGCVMPATKNAANPFFSNIRQNQDLIGGVGQMDIKIPEDLIAESEKILPKWLLEAAAKEDHGKKVSDKFLRLELAEQSRMNKALSSGVSYGKAAGSSKDVQIAGIEKGGKNRYNNIWPFEHARVRLQGRPDGACDYVNASHIKASRSNKQYIASQGPLPATFEVSFFLSILRVSHANIL